MKHVFFLCDSELFPFNGTLILDFVPTFSDQLVVGGSLDTAAVY